MISYFYVLTYIIPMISIPLIQSLNYHSCTQSDDSINVRRGASHEAARYIKEEVVVPRKDSN